MFRRDFALKNGLCSAAAVPLAIRLVFKFHDLLRLETRHGYHLQKHWKKSWSVHPPQIHNVSNARYL